MLSKAHFERQLIININCSLYLQLQQILLLATVSLQTEKNINQNYYTYLGKQDDIYQK